MIIAHGEKGQSSTGTGSIPRTPSVRAVELRTAAGRTTSRRRTRPHRRSPTTTPNTDRRVRDCRRRVDRRRPDRRQKSLLAPVTRSQGHKPPPRRPQVIREVSTVPAATFNAIGTGTAKTPPTKISGPALTSHGKPEVLYVGAEYCPYCAAERWAVAAALSRFGTLHGIGETTSSPSDVYPSTNTLSFHGATYTSPVLAFVPPRDPEQPGRERSIRSAGQTHLDPREDRVDLRHVQIRRQQRRRKHPLRRHRRSIPDLRSQLRPPAFCKARHMHKSPLPCPTRTSPIARAVDGTRHPHHRGTMRHHRQQTRRCVQLHQRGPSRHTTEVVIAPLKPPDPPPASQGLNAAAWSR